MKINMIGSFVRNKPFGTEIAFAKGLSELGVKVNTWDPSSQSIAALDRMADAVICFKDHGERARGILASHKLCKVPTIEYQPDDIRAPGIRNMMLEMRQFCDYAFTFDPAGAKIAEEELGYKKARKLLVTADPSLYRPLSIKKDIDFCFVGSMSNPKMHKSRNEMIMHLKNNGFNVATSNTFDAKEINILYNRSKVVLNHATDVGQKFGTGYGYQCRHFEAGMAGACLLSNSLLDIEVDGPKQFVNFDSVDSLLESADILLNGYYDGELWDRSAEYYHEEIMSNHLPTSRAKEIITFIEEIKDEN